MSAFVFDLNGNDGHAFPDPGKFETLACGVCGTLMNVKRNVLGPTSSAAALGGSKRPHDCFSCPHFNEDWHRHIVALKWEVLRTSSKKMREILRGEIEETLAENSGQ
ncbi:MAG: hypothetical protein HYY92_00930 [Parcubacteria group bacterium]|nr:hypothetical protein [Parcubacteria group bacterium]